MFHASVASPSTSQSQAMLLGTDILFSNMCFLCTRRKFLSFLLWASFLCPARTFFCSLFPFQKSYVFGQGWGLFYFSHRKETWALLTTSSAQESSSGLQYKTAITAQTWITRLSSWTSLIRTKSFRSVLGCFSLHQKCRHLFFVNLPVFCSQWRDRPSWMIFP